MDSHLRTNSLLTSMLYLFHPSEHLTFIVQRGRRLTSKAANASKPSTTFLFFFGWVKRNPRFRFFVMTGVKEGPLENAAALVVNFVLAIMEIEMIVIEGTRRETLGIVIAIGI
jgi:hypothetical protein